MTVRKPYLPLYARLWLAVVLAVAVLTFLVGWAWRLAADPPLRSAVVRDAGGQVVGQGARLRSADDRGRRSGGASSGVDSDADGVADVPGKSGRGGGPEFAVRLDDGRELFVHLPRTPGNNQWLRRPFGFFWTLVLVGIAVALATWPIVRKLTRRLELLRRGVERWGAGDLAARVPVRGNDEVAFVAARFNHAAERVETLVKTHQSLLANASHELRSPLTRIRMGLELMDGGAAPSVLAAGASGPDRKAEILRNIAELDQLVDEILLASRLDAREADMGTVEPVDIAGLAAEECARVDADLKAEAGDVVAPGVAKLLRRAVRNLLENARRHSVTDANDAGGAPAIDCVVRREAGWAVLCVLDRGPGVPAGQQERIFEPFYRLPGASEREGGVGLGLALVRSIALRHGGSVHCEAREGGGAVFVLRLPLAAA